MLKIVKSICNVCGLVWERAPEVSGDIVFGNSCLRCFSNNTTDGDPRDAQPGEVDGGS